MMALRVELKSRERIIIGDCVITNDDQRTKLTIEGQAVILRENDILIPDTANSPVKRICLAVQLMYAAKDPREHHDIYFTLVREILEAAPACIRTLSASITKS